VRIEQARYHEERFAIIRRIAPTLAEPSNGLSGCDTIVFVTVVGIAQDVALSGESIKPVRNKRGAVVDIVFDGQNILVHFEFSEIGRCITELLKHGTHGWDRGAESRLVGVFHLIKDTGPLRWKPRQKGSPGGRTHCGGDIVICELDTLLNESLAGGQLIAGGREEAVLFLVADNEEDVIGLL